MHYMTDGGTDTSPAPASPALSGRIRSQLQSIAMIAVFDIGGPIAAFSLFRSAGQTTISALLLSGTFPALGVAVAVARNRRLDAVGGLVLLAIAVRVLLGLATGNARIVMLEAAVPTAVFGAWLLGSLWSAKPMMYRFAHQFMGEDTPQGRDFASRWQYPSFRHSFRLMTVVWGLAYLAQATAHVVIVETMSTPAALAVSKVTPYAVTAALIAWTIAYGRWAKARGERLGAEERARAAALSAGAEPASAAPLPSAPLPSAPPPNALPLA